MAQVASSLRPRFFQVNRLILVLLFLSGIACAAFAQRQPYLLMQGPSEKKTYRFLRGEVLLWRLQGEDEFFDARIMELFPESQAIRIDDMILPMGRIAALRFRKRSAGIRGYLQGQGIVNLALLGGFAAFSERARTEQKGFMIVATAVSAAMVGVGSVGKNAHREFGMNSRYLLKVAGGDIRSSDDGEVR